MHKGFVSSIAATSLRCLYTAALRTSTSQHPLHLQQSLAWPCVDVTTTISLSQLQEQS